MRQQTESWQNRGFFAGDLPGGRLLIECQHCLNEVEDSLGSADPLVCDECGEEIFYPIGASW